MCVCVCVCVCGHTSSFSLYCGADFLDMSEVEPAGSRRMGDLGSELQTGFWGEVTLTLSHTEISPQTYAPLPDLSLLFHKWQGRVG